MGALAGSAPVTYFYLVLADNTLLGGLIMANTDMPETERNIDALAGEFKQLRTEFTRLASLLEQTARSAGAEAANRARAAGDRVWAETQSGADQVAEKIKEQPLASAGIAFGVGILLGLIFGRR